MEAIVEEATKAISELTMGSSSSASQARSKKALKKEQKMKHKEEERKPKEKQNTNKGFGMEEEEEEVRVKGPFEVHYGVANMDGESVSFDQARVMIFKEYKEKAEGFYGQPLRRFVVIIPENSYDATLHKMIRDAAITAGLDLQRVIVKGPNADQYPYGLRRRDGDPITTLDFSSSKGYGTCVDYYQNIPEICRQANGTVPDNLLDLTVEFLKVARGVDFTEDPSALQSLSEALARALLTNSKVIIKMPAADGDDPLTERTVTLRDLQF